jgi:hypothetical protein
MTEACAICPTKVLGDATRLLAGSLGEFVPPDAQMHLLNAQRELLLAIAVIIEHNSSRTPREPRGRRRPKGKKDNSRPERVELD